MKTQHESLEQKRKDSETKGKQENIYVQEVGTLPRSDLGASANHNTGSGSVTQSEDQPTITQDHDPQHNKNNNNKTTTIKIIGQHITMNKIGQ